MPKIRHVPLAPASLAVVVVLAASVGVVSIAGAATITSTAVGGSWFVESTWIGGTVPGAGDDVVIAGPVTVAGVATCASLQVTAAGAVGGAQTAPRTLHVLGPVTNAGSIGAAYPLEFQVDGDLHNGGAWTVPQTTLTGTAARMLSQEPGTGFATDLVFADGASADVTATTPVVVDGDVDLTGGRLILQPNCSLTLATGFFSGDMLAGGNEVIFPSYSSLLQHCNIDDVVLVGQAHASHGVHVTNRLVVMDSLGNGGAEQGADITVEGDLVNHGTIYHQNYFFLINVTGDVENDGRIANSQLAFQGASVTHHLTMGPDAVIVADVFLPEYQRGTIVADTPVHFAGYVGLGLGTLVLSPGSSLALDEWGSLRSGTVLANGNQITASGFATISDVTIDQGVFGTPVNLFHSNICTDGLTIAGSATSWGYDGADLDVMGLLRNDGTISDGPNPVRIRAHGDVDNQGIFTNMQLTLAGSVDQHVGAGTYGIAGEVVMESGLAGPDFQWYRDGQLLLGETATTLVLASVGPADYGTYTCQSDGVVSRNIVIAADLEATDVPGSVVGVALAQNQPNPFNPATEIAFRLDRDGPVSLVVYDLAGRAVAHLVEADLPAGAHRIRWQPQNLASGTYVYRLRAGGVELTRKCLLLE